MNLQPIRTFTRNERPALIGLGAITALSFILFVFVISLGDRRTFTVVSATPDDSGAVPGTLRSISLTFSNEARREAVEAAFRVEPEVRGVPRWRGQTFEWVLREPLDGGEYTVTLDAGTLGRASEQLRDAFSLTFTVREPGIALVEFMEGIGERLVELREGGEPRELARGDRILDYAISPDSSRVAVIVGTGQEVTRLYLIDIETGAQQVVVDSETVEVATVRWSADSQALLAVRRDELPDGTMGVPRAWLLRLSGEFVAPLDPEGEPTLAPVWSPDAQMIMYSAPATGRLVVLNLGTQDVQNLGQPRSSSFAWSPNSRLVAFEGVPDQADASNPIQPIRVRALDGSVDLVVSEENTSFSAPRFLDDEVVMGLRRGIGEAVRGTNLVFHSVEDGSLLRAVQLTPGTDLVLNWDLDPTQRSVVYTVQAGNTLTTMVLDLETGERELVTPAGRHVSWIP